MLHICMILSYNMCDIYVRDCLLTRRYTMAGVLGMILAGGEGSRLRPLTDTRTKPAVPFGGSYRLIKLHGSRNGTY